jgi:hypothetical protein
MPRPARIAATLFLVFAIGAIVVAAASRETDVDRARSDTATATSAAEPSGDAPTIPGDTTEGRPTEFLPEFEPYDYEKAAPPRRATAIDGTYIRIVTLEDAGGAEHAIPTHCLRCVPYSVDAGVQTLTLFEGRFYLEHQIDGFRALGHFVVEDGRIELFNDVNCSGVRGRYAWHARGGELTFDVLDDPCPYEDERSNDLTFGPWTAVDLCTSAVKEWYPAFLGC